MHPLYVDHKEVHFGVQLPIFLLKSFDSKLTVCQNESEIAHKYICMSVI